MPVLLSNRVARTYRQAYIFIWFPYQFGKVEEVDAHSHQIIIQQILPTRTGYNGIKSDVVVWMSSLNFTALTRDNGVAQKPWTEDDHWSKYKKNLSSTTPQAHPSEL